MNATESPALAERLDALDRKLDLAKMEEVTLWRAFRELNKPEMRRALGFSNPFIVVWCYSSKRTRGENPSPRCRSTQRR